MVNVECLNKVENIYLDGKDTVVDIKSMPYFDMDPYDIFDEKDFNKFISDLERTIRVSFEYRQLMSYLKNSEGMDECAFLENVSSRDNAKVKIEIHHSPLTLYDICMAVFKKRQANKEALDINSIAEEVMWLHYAGWVGLIPLSATVHEMVHNSYLAVPVDKVRGHYRLFINSYYNYISPDVLDAVDNIEQWTKDYNGKQMQVFNSHKIYVNANGSIELPRKDDTKATIKDKIAELKNEKPKKITKDMVKIVG
jgi:hypothetical protein